MTRECIVNACGPGADGVIFSAGPSAALNRSQSVQIEREVSCGSGGARTMRLGRAPGRRVCARIHLVKDESSVWAMTRSFPPQSGQVSMSMAVVMEALLLGVHLPVTNGAGR